jgi:hypothetical protein
MVSRQMTLLPKSLAARVITILDRLGDRHAGHHRDCRFGAVSRGERARFRQPAVGKPVQSRCVGRCWARTARLTGSARTWRSALSGARIRAGTGRSSRNGGRPDGRAEIGFPAGAHPFAINDVSAVRWRAFQRRYTPPMVPNGQNVAVLETEVVLGGADRIARYRVTGNLDELEAEISAFNQQLYTYLALFGLGMVMINAGAICWG